MNCKALGFGAAAILLAGGASAQTYVGNFDVGAGPDWSTNPPCYSGLDAAALIFGGSPSDYRISTNPDTVNPGTITDTAWYTVVGIGGGQEYASNYVLDTNNDGYAGPGWLVGDDASAYCHDNANGFINYVWRVPTPGSAALLGLGGLAALRRRR